MISIKNLSANYNQMKVLIDFNLEIKEGDSCAIIGPSGCGKSTLLKVLSGIHKQYSGEILYNGKPYLKQKIRIGYVPQTFGLLDWKTVRDNIYLPYKLNKTNRIDTRQADEIISILEIGSLLDRYPLELSGGQRQRIALARAFIYQPNVLLMDEPFSSLDSFTSSRSQELYLKLAKKYHITTLFITHNIYEAVRMCQTIKLMNKKSGNIVEHIVNETIEYSDRIGQMRLVDDIITRFESIIK